MEIDNACRRMLLADPIGTLSGYVTGKIFRARLDTDLQGTSGRAVVVQRSGGWATPDLVQETEYPVLRTLSFADPDRTPDGEISVANAADKAYAVDLAVARLMNHQRGVWWGGKGTDRGRLVISCVRASEPVEVTATDVHGTAELALRTSQRTLGDLVYVLSSWNITTIHGK